jgi:hypothetical protein
LASVRTASKSSAVPDKPSSQKGLDEKINEINEGIKRTEQKQLSIEQKQSSISVLC